LTQTLKNNAAKEPLLLSLQGPLEECGIPTKIANWIVKNLDVTTLQTHVLINRLIDGGVEFPEEYLTLSTLVTIGEYLEEFVELY